MPQPGVVIGNVIVETWALDKRLPLSTLSIISHPEALSLLDDLVSRLDEEQVTTRAREGEKELAYPLDDVILLAPIPHPPKLLCIAGNYEEHIREGGRDVTDQDKLAPRVFMKPPSTTLCGTHQAVRRTRHTRFLDYEGELAVVIGRKGKYIPVEEALEYVAGYSCFNDISERQLAIRPQESSDPRDAFFDWLNGKWMDRSAPMGPWLVTADEIPDPQCLEISVRVNGEEKQHANTSMMIFSVAELIHYISQIMTLEPGDIIATGTPAGVGQASPQGLQRGDVVEVTIERIGTLTNPIHEETIIGG